MLTDYELVLALLDLFQVPYRALADLRGRPFYVVELMQPDRCPPTGAESYYAWGMKFAASGQFMDDWLNVDCLKILHKRKLWH